jgi:hypothetical protein
VASVLLLSEATMTEVEEEKRQSAEERDLAGPL